MSHTAGPRMPPGKAFTKYHSHILHLNPLLKHVFMLCDPALGHRNVREYRPIVTWSADVLMKWLDLLIMMQRIHVTNAYIYSFTENSRANFDRDLYGKSIWLNRVKFWHAEINTLRYAIIIILTLCNNHNNVTWANKHQSHDETCANHHESGILCKQNLEDVPSCITYTFFWKYGKPIFI